MSLFKVEQAKSATETKLGDLFWDLFNQGKEIRDKEITAPLDSLLSKICSANGTVQTQIKLHVVRSEEVNAFALPDKHLVIFSGLIAAAENEGELCGVISHELAHIEKNHVMKKLVKEIGLSTLISMTTGAGGEIAKEAVRVLSSSAYDRNLEKEADIKAVDYLIKAGINPEPFANFLYKIGDEKQSELSRHLSWINTHPDPKVRAEYIIEYADGKPQKDQPVLSQETWEKLKKIEETD